MTLYVGSIAPVGVKLVVRRAAGSTLDFTTITDSLLHIRKPRPTPSDAYETADWVPIVRIISSKEVHLVYAFLAGDLPRAGRYAVAADLIIGAGIVPCDPVLMPVVERFPN